MKKYFFAIVAMIFFSLGIKDTAHAADFTYGDYTYKVETGYAVITGYKGTGGVITIPGIINGYAVKKIGEAAFLNNTKITKITMPDTVVTLEKGTFAGCQVLEVVDISSNLQVINEEAFIGCYALKEITLPETISSIGRDCFKHCINLTAINVEKNEQSGIFSLSGVLYYNGYFKGTEKYEGMLIAYPSNKADREFSVPDFVTYIRSFSSLQNLEKLLIPSSVTYIDLGAISRSMKPIDIIFKHEKAPYIGTYAFNNLASNSRIICKNEVVRIEAASSIYNKCATAVIAANVGALVPAKKLTLTSANKITLDPGESTSVNWNQTPADTTDSVTWAVSKSSDTEGLAIEPYTGKITAKYRGTYMVTGRDESNNSVSVEVTVSTRVAEAKIEIRDFALTKILDETKLSANEEFPYRIYVSFDLKAAGTNPDAEGRTSYYPEWTTSKKCHISANEDYYWSTLDFDYSPYETGEQTLNFVYKDKYGKTVAKGSIKVYVLDGSELPDTKPSSNKYKTTFTGTSSYTKTYGDADFALDTKANAGQALQYYSSDTKVATVSSKGKVTIKGAGTAAFTVKVSGDASYEDAEKKITLKVNPRTIGSASVEKIADQPYTGKAISPAVRATYNGAALKLGTDYTASYANNTETGTATVTVTGINNFSGSRKEAFQIVDVGTPSSFTQKTGGKTTTSSIQLVWNKAGGAEGYQIYRSTKRSSGYRKIVTISGGGTTTYTDINLKSGTTHYYKIRAYRRLSGTTKAGAYTGVLEASTKPAKVSLTVESGSKKAGLSWKQIKGASGYEIYRSTSKNGKYSRIKTLAKGTTKSYTDSKLSGNKTYCYRVRAYCLDGKAKVYGAYSDIRSVRTKK